MAIPRRTVELDSWRVEQGLDERDCVLNGIWLDEDPPIRDQAKKADRHHRQQRQRCASLGAGDTRAIQPLKRHGVVLVVATKGGDQHILGRSKSPASPSWQQHRASWRLFGWSKSQHARSWQQHRAS
ncbi:MAG TPA: hypothetical protein VEO54_13475 [Thermoanaerobaculia bacterium]|nr:hypothetical protein [Thermoanaerobaculia bacterium]